MNVQQAGARTRIKVCGLTRSSDVQAACAAGVDYVGFMLTRISKRHIDIAHARSLVTGLTSGVTPVLVVVNPGDEEVTAIHDQFNATALDYIIQFHGSETPERCAQVAARLSRSYWRAIPVDPADNAAQTQALINYLQPFSAAQAMVLDSAVAASTLMNTGAKAQFGGTGHTFDWNLVNWSQLQQSARSHLVLSGGLNAANVAAGIAQAQPWAVDVSSGVELRATGSEPGQSGQLQHGIKDPELIAKFVAAVRARDKLCAASSPSSNDNHSRTTRNQLPAT